MKERVYGMEHVEPSEETGIAHATHTDSLPDVLERILDKGLVIAGDIRIKLVDVELLTVHLRLLLCSVEKAREMGIDWWEGNPFLSSRAEGRKREALIEEQEAEIQRLRDRISALDGDRK